MTANCRIFLNILSTCGRSLYALVIGLLLGVLLILAAVSVAVGFRNGLRFIDFHWESAALFLQGENPYQWFFDGRDFQGVYVDATQAPSTIAFIGDSVLI